MREIIFHLIVGLLIAQNSGNLSNLERSIETSISVLNKSDFHSRNELNLLESIFLSETTDSRTSRNSYWATFANKRGLDLIVSWLNQFIKLNAIGNTTDLVKIYCGRTLSLCHFGTSIQPFRDKMIEKGMLEALLRLAFQTKKLFEDSEFSEDSLVVVTSIVAQLTFYDRWSVRSITQKVFGSDFLLVKNRFETEENQMLTLLLAGILEGKYDSVLTDSDIASLAIDPTMLWRIRDNFLSSIAEDDQKYEFQLRTHYVQREKISIPHLVIIKYFNTLLISKCNCLNLCDNQTFDYYLAVLDGFSTNRTSLDSEQELLVAGLRGIFILNHICSDKSQYLKQRLKESKSNQSSCQHVEIKKKPQFTYH